MGGRAARRDLPAVLLAAGLVASAAAARADQRKVMQAVRVARPPRIDGLLDDPAWALAVADDRFVQQQPLEDQPPSERTEVRVVYDDRALYVAFTCHDRHPDQIVARLTRRDREIESDWVAFLVDSRDDRSSAYVFRVSAAGVQTDDIYFNDIESSRDWDAVWESATARIAGGWTAEIRVPLSVLRFGAHAEDEWGFQAARYLSRNKETDFWARVPRNAQAFVSLAGRLRGLRALSPRRTLELRPYLAARAALATATGGALLGWSLETLRTDAGADAGADLKLGITSDLTLDATINPDFGQVEADQVVLNLTRFETFFPEKRPFFLESLDLFQMPVRLFYTRRIGRRPDGLVSGDVLTAAGGRRLTVASAPAALRILGAAKLTGKVAPPLQLGVVGAVTGAEVVEAEDALGAREVELAPARSFALARARWDFGDSSYLGLLATAVDRLGGHVRRASADHDAYTQGIDALWRILPEWRLTLQLFASERAGGPSLHDPEGAACDAPGPDCVPITRSDGTRLRPGDVGHGAYLFTQAQWDRYFVRASYQAFSPRLDLNDVGFLQQFNHQEARVNAGLVDLRPHGILRSYNLLPGGYAFWDFDGTLREAETNLYLEALFTNYLFLSAEVGWNYGGTFDTHETFDGARFENLTWRGVNGEASTDSRGWVVLQGGYSAWFGSDGSYDIGVQPGLAFQLLPPLELSLVPELGARSSMRFHDCRTPAGAGCTVDDLDRVYRFARQDASYLSFTLRGSYTFSPTLSLNAYAQLFMARGAWSDYREVATSGLWPTVMRAQLAPSDYAGDSDGDGRKDDDFQEVSLNLNLVLRWELQPGSTLIGVFTRSERGAVDLAGARPRLAVSGLTRGPTEDVLLLKLVYFIGR